MVTHCPGATRLFLSLLFQHWDYKYVPPFPAFLYMDPRGYTQVLLLARQVSTLLTLPPSRPSCNLQGLVLYNGNLLHRLTLLLGNNQRPPNTWVTETSGECCSGSEAKNMHADLCVHTCVVPSVRQPFHRDVMEKKSFLS